MFECLRNRRLFFDWRNNVIYEKIDGKRVVVDYDELIDELGYDKEELNEMYSEWTRTLDMLAYECSMSVNKNYVDCPVINKLDSLDRFIGFGGGDDFRVELCAYMFVGIHYGFMVWNWGNNFFHRLDRIVLWKKWFI